MADEESGGLDDDKRRSEVDLTVLQALVRGESGSLTAEERATLAVALQELERLREWQG